MGFHVLITGGSGFLGCYVAKALIERGDNVINFDTRSPAEDYQWFLGNLLHEITFERGSIEDISELIIVLQKYKIEKIIHAAAIVDPLFLLNHPILAYRVNIGGTLNVLESARILKIPKIVYISSNGVFTSKQYEPIDEEHPILLPNEGPGNGPYSISKISSEAFGMSYAEAFGLDFIALRPTAIYGFGMQFPMYIKPMVENSLRKMATRFNTGRDFPRDYTYIRDVTSAVVKALEAPEGTLKDRIFLIATGSKLVTPGEIAKIVQEFIPDADIVVGPGLTEDNKREIKYRGLINIHRAYEQLGYEPKYDIRNGVKEYIDLYQSYIDFKRQKI
jgi:nucleoside-diphosphate-sugar epimerase